MLVNKQHVMLETGVQVGLQAKLRYNVIVMAVDVSVDSVEPFEQLPNQAWKCLWECNACSWFSSWLYLAESSGGMTRTNATREHLLIIDVSLHPCHEVFNVFWGRHLCWSFEFFIVLPEILKPCQL